MNTGFLQRNVVAEVSSPISIGYKSIFADIDSAPQQQHPHLVKDFKL